MTEWLVVFTIFAGCVLALLLFIRKHGDWKKRIKPTGCLAGWASSTC